MVNKIHNKVQIRDYFSERQYVAFPKKMGGGKDIRREEGYA